MRKLTMLVALVTIFSLALAGPALADLLVNLGDGSNTYNERKCPTATNMPPFDGDETVNGNGGADVLRLQLCGDTANEPDPAGTTPDSDADVGNGGNGKDRVRVDDGDIQDTATGGSGSNDTCRGDRDLGSDNAVGDPAPIGGPDEDISDTLDPSCETIIWNTGDFYHQT
jgi:hypothetical protein